MGNKNNESVLFYYERNVTLFPDFKRYVNFQSQIQISDYFLVKIV